MHRAATLRTDRRMLGRATGSLLTLLLAFLMSSTAWGQMNGTYTIGGTSPSYTTIDAAVSALNSTTVSGPVTFLIRSGTYTPTAALSLTARSGMSATNTVTFRPDVGATVTISASLANGAIFRFNNGDYYRIDGSNVVGGTNQDMTIYNSNTGYGGAVLFEANADYNVVRNVKLMSASYYATTAYGATVHFASGGNDSNLVQNCIIGDPTGTIRSSYHVWSYGSSNSQMNIGNKILDCDILNFGQTSGSYSFYAIYVNYYNSGMIIEGNKVHQPVGAYYYYGYVIYAYEYYGYSRNTVIERNRFYELVRGTQYAYGYWFLCYHYAYYSGAASGVGTNFRFNNNMINHDQPDLYWYGLYLYSGYYSQYAGVIDVNHNTYRIAGNAGSYYTYYPMYVYGYGTNGGDGPDIWHHYNNIYEFNRANVYYGWMVYYVSTGWLSDYNIVNWWIVPYQYAVYYYSSGGGQVYATQFSQYQSSTGKDANTLTQVNLTFADAAGGDLHIPSGCAAFVGESRGLYLSYVPRDFDNQTRSTFRSDIGADEGDFNSDGIRVTAPTTGDQFTSAVPVTVTYTTNRPLNVRIELSTDDGTGWTQVGVVGPTIAGTNTFTFTTPYVETNVARIRVTSTGNICESHTSNRFAIVHPSLTVIRPNGGENLVPTDTTMIQWSSRNMTSALRVDIFYSPDGGTSWQPVAAGLSSTNVPGVNSFLWPIANAPTSNGLIRVVVAGRNEADTSDRFFTVVQQPNVTLVNPNGGEVEYVNDIDTIRWTSVTTEYVGLDYSTDGGSTWMSIANRLPAYLGQLPWVIPNTPSESTLVRITDRTRPRFTDVSDAWFAIRQTDIHLVSPNGGEKYNLNEPVTVSWTATNTNYVNVYYSTDNGSTWTQVASQVVAQLGSYTFTPVAIPTKLGRVRVVNAERSNQSDMSDGPFEIQSDRSITVLAPTGGDELVRGSTTSIVWDAPRIQNVNILYSSNGGANWQTVQTGVPAVQGSLVWTVPTQTTTQGKIRIQEVGGPIIGESGLFRIVVPTQPVLRVIAPNGGEIYTEGDPVTISWTAADVQRVSLHYSTNGGTSWTLIAQNVSALLGQYAWTAPNNPGTEYRVRAVSSSPSVTDMSDGNFTVTRRLTPSLTILTPNGGETYAVDSMATVEWSATDVTGNVVLKYTVDGGTTWTEMGTVPSQPGQYVWRVPNEVTSQALVRVESATDATVNDASDGVFSIVKRQLGPIAVMSPNGGEVWKAMQDRQIEWTAPAQVTRVNIEVSTDGGGNWTMVATDVASVGVGTNSYLWSVLSVPSTTSAALIRVTNADDASHFDLSDNVFTIEYATSGVGGDVVTGGLRLIGNYPNPFAGQTEVTWDQSKGGDVEIVVYSVTGTKVGEYAGGYREVGEQRLVIDGRSLSAGQYMYEVRTGHGVVRGTMTVVR